MTFCQLQIVNNDVKINPSKTTVNNESNTTAPEQTTVKAENTYMHPAIDSKKELVDWVLTMLGHPLVTVELTESQLDVCIANALQLYTKYAYFPEQYLVVNVANYEPGIGLDLKPWNVAVVRNVTVGYQGNGLYGLDAGDVFFGMGAFMRTQFAGSGFLGSAAGHWSGNWITYQNFQEYAHMVNRMCGSNPDWVYHKSTFKLQLIPEPRMIEGNSRWLGMALTVECEPPLAELYGNEYVKRIVLAYAKILLGTVRSKFTGVQLVGGGQVNTAIGDQGQQELQNLIATIRKDESRGNMFFIA